MLSLFLNFIAFLSAVIVNTGVSDGYGIFKKTEQINLADSKFKLKENNSSKLGEWPALTADTISIENKIKKYAALESIDSVYGPNGSLDLNV